MTQKLDSIQYLIDTEGYRRKQINGVRCLVKDNFVIPNSRQEYFTPDALVKIVEKKGTPYRYHGNTPDGSVLSIELYEEA